jgi:hypothetical protein
LLEKNCKNGKNGLYLTHVKFNTSSLMISYTPHHFSDLFKTKLGGDIWKFLTERDNIIRMETASKLGHPAVEAIGNEMITVFGKKLVMEDRVKQMTGHMIRQILEDLGFVIHQQRVRCRKQDLFTSGTRYTKP